MSKSKSKTIFHRRNAFSALILAQVLSRLVPFLANIFLFRKVRANEVGTPLVDLPLAFACVANVRDGLRRSLLREEEEEEEEEEEDADEHDKEDQERNAFRMAKTYIKRYIVFCSLVGLGLLAPVLLFLTSDDDDVTTTRSRRDYRRAVAACVVAAFIELTSEPQYIWLQKKHIFGPRVITETLGTIMRSAVLFSMVEKNVLYAFAFAQVAQSCATSLAYVTSYYVYCDNNDNHYHRKKEKKLSANKAKSDKNNKRKRLIDSFLYQSYLKLALAEGEKFVLILSKSEDSVMGVFGLVSNLGSLFVRLVLQPFEEIAFMTFATSNTKEKKKKNLIDILSISVLVGSIAFFIGPFFAKDVMYFLYGKIWMEDGTETLKAFARLILPLSINGIVEGFAHAVMTEKEIKREGNTWLVACSFVNSVLGYLFLRYSRIGAAGLVYSNFISLVLRIYLTSKFLNGNRGKGNGHSSGSRSSSNRGSILSWREVLPARGTIIAVALSAFSLMKMEEKEKTKNDATPHFKHTVVKGGIIAVTLLMTVFVCERDRFRRVFGKRRKLD